MWVEGADGLIIPRFHSECCWHSGTSQPGHDSTKLLPQRGHQTSCTGGPFVLCFRSLFLACWPEWWNFGCWEQGEQRAIGWTEPLRAMPHWFKLKKRRSFERPWTTLLFPDSYPVSPPRVQTSHPPLPSHRLCSCSENTLAHTVATHSHISRTQGRSTDSNNNEDVVNLPKRVGGLQHRRVIN